MKEILALTVGGTKVNAPSEVPTGGLEKGETILKNGITIFLILAVTFALVMMIWGGISWITSNGDKAKIQSARNKLIFAILGLILAFLSFAIIMFIGDFFNTTLIS